MRYEDASHTGAFAQGSEPDARNDADAIAAGAQGPATGNVITGEGTQTGPSGSDYGPGAHITSIAGSGGEDSSFAGGKLAVSGEFGRLSIDAEGNYSYQAKANTPENSRDSFTYTLSDAQGNADTATLMIEIGKTPAVIKANAQQVVPGPDGVVILPPGVELSDIQVVGRNLVINLPDGSQMVIIDGAVFVPQLVLGGVEVPATNLAALLVGQEIAPAAGEGPPQSSGGNFDVPVPPLDPGIPLGDLLPPTELFYTPPEVREVFDLLDEEPETGPNPDVLLDDDAQEGGIAGGVGDDPGTDFASGFLSGSGGDGSLTWDLLATGAPTGFSYADGPNGSILVFQNGNPNAVLTITIDPDTGEFTVTQNGPIDHPAGGDENNQLFTIDYTVTDEDGDFAPGSFVINVDDDTPTIDVTVGSDANVLLTTQDAQTDGDPTDTDTDSTSADFGGIFGASGAFGADGPGTSSLSYALSTTGGASGLASHGAAINLYLIGGVVVGSTAANAGAVNAGNTVFDISVNAVGVVTVNQYSQIDHTNTDPTPTGPGYEDHLITLADGAVTLTLSGSITDGDQDTLTDSASVGIGANIRFADDGPSIDPTLNEVGGAVVDESAPVEAATIPLADGFTRGDDPDLPGELAIGKGSTSGPVIDANAAFGADGPANGGGISYALDVLNTVSGLTTTAGTAINLVELSNGVVVGVVDGTTTVAFAISIDSGTGVVTVEQYLSLFHSDSPDNHDEPAFLDEGSLGVTVTASDFDGDSVTSDAVDITSLIRFEDDGPTASGVANPAGAVTVDESGPTSASTIEFTGPEGDDGDVGGSGPIGRAVGVAAVVNGTGVFGADGPAADAELAYSLALGGSDTPLTLTDGSAIELQLIDGVIVGVVTEGPHDGDAAFAIAINPSTGVATVELYLSLDHPDITDPNDSLPLGPNTVDVIVTATDGDNDTADSDPIDISGLFNFLDDGPTAGGTVDAQGAVTVDESGPTGASTIEFTGDEGDDLDVAGTGPIGRAVGGTAVVDGTGVFGADGPAADAELTYALALGSTDTPLTLTDGSAIELQLIDGVIVGVVTEGTHDGDAAFAIAIDPNTGVATVELYLSLDHPINPDPNDSLPLGPNTVSVVVTATDGDGDSDDSAPVDISALFNFLDDGPTVTATLSTAGAAEVDESLPVSAPTIDTGDFDIPDDPHLAGGFAIGTGSTAGAVINASAAGFGADGPGGNPTYDLVILNADSGLTTTEGDAINLVQLDSGVVVGVVQTGTFAGDAAFAISINSATGVVTVEQYVSLDHPIFPDNFDEPTFLDEGVLGATITATDGDGDPDTSNAVDIGSKIRFEDDGPSATDEPQQDVAEGNQTVSGTFDFVGGADGATVTHINGIALVFGGGGFSQWIAVDDGQIRAQADGDYEFQSDASGSGVTSGTFTVTDGDGDQVVADWAFNITDANAPTAGVSAARLDDDGLANGNPLSVTGDIDANVGERPGEENSEEDIFNGQLTLNFGGDGPGTVTFAAMHGDPGVVGAENVIYSWNGGTSTLTATVVGGPRNGTPLFDIVVDQTTGEYTLTLRDNVIHADGGNETSAPNVALTYTVTDSDNSPAGGVDGTLNITFNDDAPTLTNVLGASGVTLDETTAGTPAGFPISLQSAAAMITATQAFGADGAAAAGSVVYGLSITGGPGSGLQTAIGNFAITLVQIDGNTIQGQYNGANVAFTIDIASDGKVTLTQEVPLEHNDDGGPAPTDHNDSLDLTGLISASITIKDGDNDTATASTPIGDDLVFLDDGPDSEVDAEVNVPTLTLDETRPIGEDSDSGDDDPAGLATVTVGFADNFQTADHGADGPGTVSYALVLAAEGAASGLYALDNTDTESVIDGYGQGDEILMFTELDGSITGRLTVDGDVYFTISVDGSGSVTFEQSLNVWHADTDSDDDTSELSTAAETLQLVQTVTDADGDFDTAAIDLSDGVFFIEDDGPEVLDFTDAQGDNTGLTPTAEGIFDFDIGTDSPNGGDDDIFIDPTSVVIEINNVAIDPADITFTDDGEDADFANYSFEFPYDTGAGGEVTATGTLVFDKNAGTYVVTLTSGPIQGFSTLETADGTAFVGYELNDDPSDPDVPDNTQPQVAVTTILEETDPGVSGDGFYVQFTGFTAGNGSHETIDYDLVSPPDGDGVDATWTEGELISEGTGATALTQSWVSVSNASNGVGGDTVNGPDALNFSLYSSDPGGTFGGTPTASASDMFLVFDGTDSGDDFIVVLKLFDPDSGEYTTKSIIVEGSDIYFFGAGEEAATVAALAGTPYEGVVADIVALGGSNNNDGLLIIESNDYNTGSENWEIVGAQIVNTNAGVSGTGINLDGDVGDDGNSTGTQAFSVVDDSAPMKITNIGFLAGSSNDQAMEISFDVTITDADGDSQTTSLTATIGEPPVETLAAASFSALSASNTSDGGDSFSNLSFSNDNSKWNGFGNGNGNVGNTGIVAGMVAASGMAAMSPDFHMLGGMSSDLVLRDSFQQASTQLVGRVDGGAISSLSFGNETSELAFDAAPMASSGHNFNSLGDVSHMLDATSSSHAISAATANWGADQGPAINIAAAMPVAPAIAMISADMMRSAGLEGIAQHGGSVEKILAEALGHGGPPTVDGLLQAITGHGGGAIDAIVNGASPAAPFVPAWDMGFNGAIVPGADMMFRMGAEMLHHDAVQPVVNG